MKAESMQLLMIPITQNNQGVSFAPNHGDALDIKYFLFSHKYFILFYIAESFVLYSSQAQCRSLPGP